MGAIPASYEIRTCKRRNDMTARWNTIVSMMLGLVSLIVFVTGLVTGVSLTSFIVLAVIAVAT